MNIISVVRNSKQIQNSATGFNFYSTIEPHRQKLFSKKENTLIFEMLTGFNAFIGGGFAAHCYAMEKGIKLPYGDIDFYFHTEEDFQKAILYVKAITGYSDHQLEAKPYMAETVRASTFDMEGRTYQLVCATYGNVQETFDTFDFSNSKVAIVYNPTDQSQLEFHVDEKFPKLLEKQMVEYRVQHHLKLDTLEAKKLHAKGNIRRLEKYLERFPGGFWDEESKTQMFQQYAWDLKFFPQEPYNCPELCRLLTTATQDQLIIFFPLGGQWKKGFETHGAHYKQWAARQQQIHVGVAADMQVSLGNPDQSMWDQLAQKLIGRL